MQTLTMQGIADLAQVRRPVVSVWRTRYAASSPTPFPAPESHEPLLFDAAKVAAWLSSTGRGNNPDAGLESPLYSDAVSLVTARPGSSSALLLAACHLGEPLGSLSATDLTSTLGPFARSPVLDHSTLQEALSDEALLATVDDLVEAAFSPARVLDVVVESFSAAGGAWSTNALTARARSLFGEILAELHRTAIRVVVPHGAGGLLLAGELSRCAPENAPLTVGVGSELPNDEFSTAALRNLAARGAGFKAVPAAHAPALHLMMEQDLDRTDAFFAGVDRCLSDLGDEDLLVVVGHAQALIGPEHRPERAQVLAPSKGHPAPLRYAAELPKGLSRFGGRRPLAIWVFAPKSDGWTVVAAHGGATLDHFTCAAIAADVAASVSDPADLKAHAFLRSAVRQTAWVARQPEVRVRASSSTAPSGGERLARIWTLRDLLGGPDGERGLSSELEISATAPAVRTTVSLSQACGHELLLDLPGARISAEHLASGAAGTAWVIGPDEIRNEAMWGTRGIDRLLLERVAPRARLTEPGDVVYVAAGGAAAAVDDAGGHVVLAPARIARCLHNTVRGRTLIPAVVAADIASQTSPDRRTWQLRTLDAGVADAAADAAADASRRRRELRRELQLLDELEREIVDGLADGALTPARTIPEPRCAATKDAR